MVISNQRNKYMSDALDFNLLSSNHRERIYRLCQSIVHDTALAEDLTQNTFLHAYQHLDSLRDPRRFGSWLTRIAKNLAFTALKAKKPPPLSYRDELYQSPISAPNPIGTEEEMALIFEALSTLTAEQRAVFELHEIERRSHKEIAQLLHITEGTSRSRLYYARRKMRIKLRAFKGDL